MYENPRSRRKRNGGAIWSFLHIDDAAHATVAAAEARALGVCNIVDNEPATVAKWLPELARLTGSEPPRHIPVWLARFVVGQAWRHHDDRHSGGFPIKKRNAPWIGRRIGNRGATGIPKELEQSRERRAA